MDREGKRRGKRTLMYTEVPTKVLAIELISSPETPKSMSLMSPCELHRIFDGLISRGAEGDRSMSFQELRCTPTIKGLTTMNDLVHVIQVQQPLQHASRHHRYDIDIDRAYLLVDTVERAFVHELHADADVRLCEEGPVRGDDKGRVAVVHNL